MQGCGVCWFFNASDSDSDLCNKMLCKVSNCDFVADPFPEMPLHSDLKRPDMWPILITGKPLNLYQWFWYFIWGIL